MKNEERRAWPRAVSSSLSAFFLISILIFPSRIDSWFNGAPWSNRPELAVVAVILPSLVILGRSFLASRRVAAFWGAMLAIKVGLALFAPPAGWRIKVFDTPSDAAHGRWERTYESIWRGDASDVLERPLKTKRDFPIEWLNRYNRPDERGKGLWVEVEGFADIPRGCRLTVVTKGAAKGRWECFEEGKPPKTTVPKGSFDRDALSDPEGWWEEKVKIRGQIYFQGDEWSLEPMILFPDGRMETAVSKGVLWQTAEGAELSEPAKRMWISLSQVVDFGLVGFWVLWGLGIIRDWLKGRWITPFWLCFIVGSGFLPWLGKSVAMVLLFSIGWSVLHEKTRERWEKKPGTINFLLVGPLVLSFFARRWWPEIGQMTFFSIGDDWTDYQNLARDIVVQGDFFQTNQPLFVHQPLYRYVVALLHLFFGQSTVSLKFLDVWSVLGASAILVLSAVAFGLPVPWALGASLLYLTPTFGSAFRHHIGGGLQEYAAMFFLMAAVWTVLRSREGRLGRAVLAGFVASVGFWLRMDHLGVSAAAAFLIGEATSDPSRRDWDHFVQGLSRHQWWLSVFFATLGLAFFLIPFRNWAIGGRFVVNAPSNVDFLLVRSWSTTFHSFRLLLFASEGPPSWTAMILVPGTVVGLIALAWRRGPLAGYPLSLGILLIGLLALYLFLKVNAYTPRFSIHLLPLAALSLIVFSYHSWTQAKAKCRRTVSGR